MWFPSPERMRSGSIFAKLKTKYVFRCMPKETLCYVHGVFNHWDWPTRILGPAPTNWETLPNYRKPWMPEGTVTREEYIRPYMHILHDLGISFSD